MNSFKLCHSLRSRSRWCGSVWSLQRGSSLSTQPRCLFHHHHHHPYCWRHHQHHHHIYLNQGAFFITSFIIITVSVITNIIITNTSTKVPFSSSSSSSLASSTLLSYLSQLSQPAVMYFFQPGVLFCKENVKSWTILTPFGQFRLFCCEFTHFLVYFLQA